MELQSNNSHLELRNQLRSQIKGMQPSDFEAIALQVFQYQVRYNPVYAEFIYNLSIDIGPIRKLTDIPFLPIQFFKNHLIRTGEPAEYQALFESSGTTGSQSSRHALYDAELYRFVSGRIFEANFGKFANFHIFALLPSYLERNNSSLVYMMQYFIDQTHSEHAGFYLHNVDEMLEKIKFLAANPDGKKVLLLGVTFALLDLAESDRDLSFFRDIPELMVMDTGGMKGRRAELLREEVHDLLIEQFGVSEICSEYGMTELLSQSYSTGHGIFKPGYTMRILLRDVNDPFSRFDHDYQASKTGGINVIDLANLDTCAFIETQDLGRFGEQPGSFYVMGRFDNSDIRGCNLMVL